MRRPADDWSTDVIVVGLGVMGSAAADALAGRGHRVIGFDAWGPEHVNGSSHGATRIIRRLIEEGPIYEPMIADAFKRWQALEADAQQELVNRCGVIRVGRPSSPLLTAARQAATAAALPFEELGADDISCRFPGLRVPDGYMAIFEATGGVVHARQAVEALRARAVRRGASLRFNQQVLHWQPEGSGVLVTTARGSSRCARMVIAAGAWTGHLASGLGLPLVAHRVVNVTFEPLVRSRCEPPALPAFIISTDDATDGLPSLHGIYGTPAVAGQGVKVGTNGTPTDPDNVIRTVAESEIGPLRALVESMLPDAAGPVMSTLTCLYTKTPDEHFALGIHPDLPQVVVASPCSGHGFKFAPAIGSLLADLATDTPPPVNLEPFALHRFWRNAAQDAEVPAPESPESLQHS